MKKKKYIYTDIYYWVGLFEMHDVKYCIYYNNNDNKDFHKRLDGIYGYR